MKPRAVAAGAVLAAVLTGCASGTGSAEQAPAGSPQLEPNPTPAPVTPDDGPEPVSLTKEDVVMRVRITHEKCFGSIGCNIEYQVKPSLMVPTWGPESTLDSAYSLTYKVTGLEQPVTNTIRLQKDGSYRIDRYFVGQTPSADTELQVEVVSLVQAGEW